MIRLEKVHSKNVWQIVSLRVSKVQEDFVATNAQSIIEAYTTITANGVALPFGIYDDDLLVGFVMIGYNTDDMWDNAPKIAKGNYNLWRLMIDEKYQGKGYGKKAIEEALKYIRTFPFGKAKYCYLSYNPDNKVAEKLYLSCGFTKTGEKDDDEIVMALEV